MSPPRVVLSEPLYSLPCCVVLHPIEMAGVVTGTPSVGVKAVWSVESAVAGVTANVGPDETRVGPVGTIAAVVGAGTAVVSVVAPGMAIENGIISF